MNPARVARGLAMLARFRPEGFSQLGGNVQDVLSSLAPLLAFPLVVGVLHLLGGGDSRELAGLLAVVSVLLAPMVVSHFLARRWQREESWGSYAVAFNWGQWVVTLVVLLALVGANMLAVLGLPRRLAAGAALLAIVIYQLALQFFLARRGLGLPPGRAVLMVVAVEAVTSLLLVLFVTLDPGGPLDGTD